MRKRSRGRSERREADRRPRVLAQRLEDLARRAGLEPVRADDVDAPFETRDEETPVRGLLAPGGVTAAIEHAGVEAVRETILLAAGPFRRADGSYRFEKRFRYVVCSV